MFINIKLRWPYFKELFGAPFRAAWKAATGSIITYLAQLLAWHYGVVEMNYTIPIIVFFLLFFVFIFEHAYRLNREKTSQIKNLEKQLKSKLELSCGKDIGGCRAETSMLVRNIFADLNTQSTSGTTSSQSSNIFGKIPKCTKISTIFWRIKVNNIGQKDIINCSGSIISILRGDKVLLDGSCPVPFASGNNPDAFNKKIKIGTPEYLDVLYIADYNKVKRPPYPDEPLEDIINKLIDEIGEYKLTVNIKGDNTPNESIKLLFNWTGNWQTAEMEECHEENT